ncbi:MAG: hypothetical protein OEV41_08120, partial [Gammaproteobacteria bacterium]|nr:hypothetical protein [Gammaproteobacteria bacterium]
TFFLLTFFFEAAFFFATFFFETFFFAAGFLRDDAFFGDTFFLLTFRFDPWDVFRVTGLRPAAFFREAFAGARFLLAVFFAGIIFSCRSEKNAQLYIAVVHMEGAWDSYRPSGPIEPEAISGAAPDRPAIPRGNRFMPKIPLHYAD